MLIYLKKNYNMLHEVKKIIKRRHLKGRYPLNSEKSIQGIRKLCEGKIKQKERKYYLLTVSTENQILSQELHIL
jgi:transposase